MSTAPLVSTWENAEIIGIDMSKEMLEKAREILPTVTFIQRDCSKPLLDVGTFDLIFSNAFVQWLPNQGEFITNAFAMLNENGIFAAQIPLFEEMPANQCIVKAEVFLAPVMREISWSNNVVIMEKCKDDLQREFYIKMTMRYGWTKRILTNFIKAKTYEKYLSNQTNFDMTLPEERKVQAKLTVKDEYTFDFAELSLEYSEHELEMQLVNNVKAFLIEMGGDFTFIGNQYHLVVGSRDIYIDLLLFPTRLRSLVAIELKIGEYEAEYAGKMRFGW